MAVRRVIALVGLAAIVLGVVMVLTRGDTPQERAEQQATAAATTFLTAAQIRDADGLCAAITVRTRRALVRLARARGQSRCAQTAVEILGPLAGSSRNLRARVASARATVSGPGLPAPLHVARESGAWRVAALSSGEAAAQAHFRTSCSRLLGELAGRLLPPADAATLARDRAALRRTLARTRRELTGVDLGTAAQLSSTLRAGEQALRRLDGATPASALRGQGEVERQLRAGLVGTSACGVDPTGDVPARLRTAAADACARGRATKDAIGDPRGPEELRELAVAYEQVGSGLRALSAPAALTALLRDTAGAVAAIGAAVRDGADAVDRLDSAAADAADSALSAATARASIGLTRLRFTGCSGL